MNRVRDLDQKFPGTKTIECPPSHSLSEVERRSNRFGTFGALQLGGQLTTSVNGIYSPTIDVQSFPSIQQALLYSEISALALQLVSQKEDQNFERTSNLKYV